MKYANLHLHSFFSDGQMTPQQLVIIGKCMGYKALALTDHCTDGGNDEFFMAAKLEGLDAISGVEFDGPAFGADFHITALDFDRDEPAMRAFIKRLCDDRTEYTRKAFEMAREKGFIDGITWNDVLDSCKEGYWVCIDHVITLLKKKRIIPVTGGKEIRAFFRSPEVKVYSPKRPNAEEIIKTIRGADGIAVLAHPYKQTQYVGKLVDMGLNGIEISHPHIYEQYPRLALRAAEEYKLYRSGGTDHTGAMSGCNGRNAIPSYHGITEEEYLTIKERKLG
jgi:predicted metal-dependent phosphoesterase TrpH